MLAWNRAVEPDATAEFHFELPASDESEQELQ
jgi:hypothetical protein